MYRAFGLLRPDSDFSIDEAKARLTAKLPGFTVTSDPNQIVVSQGEWWIALAIVSGPEIQNETEGLVGRLAGVEPSEADLLASSDRRVEVWTDVPDPFMEHFDHYLSVIEVLKSFEGLLAVDPKEPGTM
jgi:hypothetical protein